MDTLNLTKAYERMSAELPSDVMPYKKSQFPDGQQNIEIIAWTYDGTTDRDPANQCRWEFSEDSEVRIESRLNSFRDLEVILCATASLRGMGIEKIHLYVPYFLGSRSDRKFCAGGNNYLKDVICPIINAQGYASVRVLDPHSDVLEACLQGFKKEPNDMLIKNTLHRMGPEREDIVFVAPDAGAGKRAASLAKGHKVLTATKVRDVSTGAITGTEIFGLDCEVPELTLLIVDDICDGGRTFIELAKVIRQLRKGKTTEIHLAVTHGIFSAGLEPFKGWIDQIHSTNSYQDLKSGPFAEANSAHLGMIHESKVI
jgi:ribose-phosphate pyrophosphokinase